MKFTRIVLCGLAFCMGIRAIFAVQPAISAGYTHSLFLKSDGIVWATGWNGDGELGDGTRTARSTPIPVMADVSAISAHHRGYSTCSYFLKTDGTCWATGRVFLRDGVYNSSTPQQFFTDVSAISTGGGEYGLLLKLDGGVTNSFYFPSPFVTGVKAISAGWGHSLFLKTDGAVWATGRNDSGELGDGTFTDRNDFDPVLVMDGVSDISAGGHSLFQKTDGTVWATGRNVDGQLGDGTATSRSTPVQVLSGVSAISAGANHSLFLKSDGTVWATGANDCGQLGDGTFTNRSTPVQVMISNLLPPQITVQPAVSFVALSAQTATLSVTAIGGTPALTYQWRKDGFVIPGATSAAITFADLKATDSGSYRCVVTNSVGAVTSDACILTVYAETNLTIRNQPIRQVVTGGSSATFTVIVTSAEPIGYQWRRNGVSIPGATSSSHTIPSVSSSDSGTYSCIVSDYDELLLSSGAALTVHVPPAITSQPSSLTVLQNATAAFSVTATGTQAPTYQWQLNGTPIPSATLASYSISSAQAANAGSYTCVVTNAAGSVTSSAATLTVNIPATITSQPSSVSVNPAASATLSVTATGTGTLGYQWRKNGRDIGGATASTLTLTDVRFLDEAKYTCLVSNSYGSVLSNAATLTVSISPTSPDSDGDGISDALETYLSVFGLDPAVDSTEEWVRLLAMIPDLGFYYTADQMRNLAVGSPVLQRSVNGNFLLDVTVQESTNLNTWTQRTLSSPMITTPGGGMRLELPPLDSSTQFYRLQSQPAP